MISLVIPTYRNPEHLDICLKSATEGQKNKNQILVVVDGYVEESREVLQKYPDTVSVLPLQDNQGMQSALNLGVMNATNEIICIINDDNVLCKDWDVKILEDFVPGEVLTINQIEPTGPGIFNFPVKNFGKEPSKFNLEDFWKYEEKISKKEYTPDGGIFPFVITKKDYMIVGGFDTMYQSPFVCDWDFFLKLDLNEKTFRRTHHSHFYHFGSSATKNGKEAEKFKASENPAVQTYIYKWGMKPALLQNNSHRPKGIEIRGIKF